MNKIKIFIINLIYIYIYIQVREHAAAVLAGLMKGEDGELSKNFRERAYNEATKLQKRRKQRSFFIDFTKFQSFIPSKQDSSSCFLLYFFRSSSSGPSIASVHGCVLALVACVLSVPYDMPR